MALLDPLKDNPMVVESAEQVGQMFVRGVKGQLGEGQRGDGAPCGWFEVSCLLVEIGVGYGCQHVQGVVKVLRASLQRRQGRQGRQRGEWRRIGAGEGEGASKPLLWNRRRGAIREKSHLVSGGI